MGKIYNEKCNLIIKLHSEPLKKFKIKSQYTNALKKMDEKTIFDLLTAKYTVLEKKSLHTKWS